MTDDLWPSIKITKLEAARRQLDTAIRLWFNDDDPVSVHVLAFSAYDVIHAVSKKRNPDRPDLLFDTTGIKEQFRKEWAILIKTPSGFFKHARNDPEGTIEFQPQLSELFITFAIRGIAACRLDPTAVEAAFMMWSGIHNPSFFTEKARKRYIDCHPIETIEDIRRMPRRMFLDAFLQGRNSRPPTI